MWEPDYRAQAETQVFRRWIVAKTPRDTPERRAAQQAMEGGGRRRRTYTIAMDEKRRLETNRGDGQAAANSVLCRDGYCCGG